MNETTSDTNNIDGDKYDHDKPKIERDGDEALVTSLVVACFSIIYVYIDIILAHK